MPISTAGTLELITDMDIFFELALDAHGVTE
jgi:hypothetical protein